VKLVIETSRLDLTRRFRAGHQAIRADTGPVRADAHALADTAA
jgi:hypothetical protein